MRSAWILSASLACLSSAQTPADLRRFEAVEPYMGTLVRITVYASSEQAATTAFRAGFDRTGTLDRTLSDYKPDSELSRITSAAVHRAVTVSDDLFTVLSASQDLAQATGGAFDITQGPVIRLWREARTTGRVADAAALAEARSRSGFRRMHLDAEHRSVLFDRAGMALDVGAIGKGYAASEALKAIGHAGIRSALVAVSGDLAFSDAPPGQSGWRINIHDDDPNLSAVPAVLELSNLAVSTSGNAEQHVDIDGRRYSHVVDPASGMGLAGDITVTVIAPTGLEADGLDTAASVLGLARGLALLESCPAAAGLMVQRAGSGVTVRQSSRFLELVARAGRSSSGSGQAKPR